jgi:O-antigen ligase
MLQPSVRFFLACTALVLPFLFGYTLGPAANMLPLLFGLGCAGAFVLFSPAGALRSGSCWALLALPFVLQVHSLLVPPADAQLVMGTALALLAFWAVAEATSGWQAQQKADGLWGAVLLAALLNSAICVLQYQGWVGVLSPWLNPGNPARVFGNLRQPNQMATLSAMGFAILLLYVPHWAQLTQARHSKLKTALALAALLLLAFACAATRSRTGLLQWLGVWVAVLFWVWRGRALRVAALWASIGLLFYGLCIWLLASHTASGGEAANTLARLSDAGQDARTALWIDVWQTAAQQPWLGWGWGNLGWGLLNTPLQGEVFAVPLDNAHNLPLHLAAELGWPLALLFCAAFLCWVLRRQPWQAARPAQQSAWLVLAAIGVHSLLEYPLWYAPFLLAAAMAVGVLAAASSGSNIMAINRPRLLGLLLLALSWAFAIDWVRTVQVYMPPEQRWALFTDRRDWVQANSQTWWFASYADFAQMGITQLRADNAAQELARAQRLLHYSSEARVLHRAHDAAVLLGDKGLAAHYEQLIARRWPNKASAPPPRP